MQKVWRMLLVTVTLVTLCIVFGLVSALGLFVWQRGRELIEGAPEVRNGITILVASILINAVCICGLLQIKKLDRKLIPKSGH